MKSSSWIWEASSFCWKAVRWVVVMHQKRGRPSMGTNVPWEAQRLSPVACDQATQLMQRSGLIDPSPAGGWDWTSLARKWCIGGGVCRGYFISGSGGWGQRWCSLLCLFSFRVGHVWLPETNFWMSGKYMCMHTHIHAHFCTGRMCILQPKPSSQCKQDLWRKRAEAGAQVVRLWRPEFKPGVQALCTVQYYLGLISWLISVLHFFMHKMTGIIMIPAFQVGCKDRWAKSGFLSLSTLGIWGQIVLLQGLPCALWGSIRTFSREVKGDNKEPIVIPMSSKWALIIQWPVSKLWDTTLD